MAKFKDLKEFKNDSATKNAIRGRVAKLLYKELKKEYGELIHYIPEDKKNDIK